MLFDFVWDNKLLFRKSVFASYRGVFAFWVSLERHSSECNCFYCREVTGILGFCFPVCKAPSAWRRFYVRWVSGTFHLRTTFPEWACKRTTEAQKVAMRLRGDSVKDWC